jgi:hypothetical protein
MESRNFGENDPVTALQKAAVQLLRTEVGRWRARQLDHRRSKLPLDAGFAETVGMLARSVATLTAELRKGGKDMRDAGKKWNPRGPVAKAATAAYLRSLSAEERDEVIRQANADA